MTRTWTYYLAQDTGWSGRTSWYDDKERYETADEAAAACERAKARSSDPGIDYRVLKKTVTETPIYLDKATENYHMEYTIYSKPGCPFCEKAKALLFIKHKQYKEIMLDVGQPNPEGKELLKLAEFKQANPTVKSLPYILLGEEVIGGYTELAKTLP
jgi:glutaredoxin